MLHGNLALFYGEKNKTVLAWIAFLSGQVCEDLGRSNFIKLMSNPHKCNASILALQTASYLDSSSLCNTFLTNDTMKI